jgi:hypothetical protein
MTVFLKGVLIVMAVIYFGLTPAANATLPVDLELVLAVDVSRGINEDEARRQREGYAKAFTDPTVIKAITSGLLRRIAVVYVEWANPELQTVVIDWTLIRDKATAHAFARQIAAVPPNKGPSTSISAVIRFAIPMFETNNYIGTRRVIDISGDGVNNTGGLITVARAAALAKDITINGLPITDNWPNPPDPFAVPDLGPYYRHCVIGGPGAFMIEALSFRDFAKAVRRKLILEIAGLVPVGGNRAGKPPLLHRVSSPQGYGPGCDIGEVLYRKHKSGYGGFDN